jgi:sialic acid synthase SpsE
MDTIRNAFGLPVGYSDHTMGIHIPIAAVARGACIIEKHFTLDRKMEGPDHRASIEPFELKQMVQAIRDIEKAIGNGIKIPTLSELKNINIARKSIVAASEIREGDFFTKENLTTKRPGSGESPLNFWRYLGEKAAKPYFPDDLIL